VYNAAVAAVSDGTPLEKEGEEKLKVHTHSYCCLDYAQVRSIVSFSAESLEGLHLHFSIERIISNVFYYDFLF